MEGKQQVIAVSGGGQTTQTLCLLVCGQKFLINQGYIWL